MLNLNRRNYHNDLLHCSTHPWRMLPSGRLSYNLFFADRLESNQRHMDYKSKDSVITAADYVLPSETIARWLLHDATVITASLLTMMLFRIVSGLWDEVTPHYVNWVVVLQGNHRKDLYRHPQKGHEHSIRPARYGTKHISPTALAWVTGAGFEPANSGLWAQNDTTSPPRAKNRSNNRTTDRSLANIASD